MISLEKISKKIDYTLLKSHIRENNIRKLCEEAVLNNFHSVCINSIWLNDAKKFIDSSSVKLCTVAGFPLGSISTKLKIIEVENCIENGASEVDVVMNIGYFKDKRYKYISDEISKIVHCADGKIIKIIIESGVLSKEEIIVASKIVEDNGAHYIKTSTGFASFGASPKIISIIKSSTNSKIKIKASGGIKSYSQIKKLIDLGVDRIGTSSGVIIMKELNDNGCKFV